MLTAVKQTKEVRTQPGGDAFVTVSNNGEPKLDVNNKKLICGKCAKPDDTDIQIVVKYAHETLDPRHVLDRNFDKLNFSQLVAGELELISRKDVSDLEHNARIQIDKTICYHKQYLSDYDLRSGYDTVLKKVEQGSESWSDKLGEQLHQLYNYRALAIMREKMQNARIENSTVATNKHKIDKKSPDKSVINSDDQETNRPIFCMEYNQGACRFNESHEGHFAGKKTIKWHICRKCRRMGTIAHHPEKDCPKK